MNTVTIMSIVGSLRAGSVNAATSRAAVSQAPEWVNFVEHDIGDLPLFNGDLEVFGLPDSVKNLHATAASADGLIFFSPEYNGSIPGVTKNVIDWLSRPPKGWEGKGVTLVSTTPGPRAGQGVRSHFEEIVEFQPVKSFGETLGIGDYREKINDDNEVESPDALAAISEFVERFASFCA